MKNTLKVLVVDDSALYRSIIAQVIKSLPNVEVVAKAADGQSALDQIERYQPDLITLDIEMPILNGVETLKRVRRQYPKIKVVMCSALTAEGADITLQCLQLGALDFITKPDLAQNSSGSKQEIQAQLEPIIKQIQQLKEDKQKVGASDAKQTEQENTAKPTRVHHNALKAPGKKLPPKILLIGCSTGGPVALQALIPKLPGDFPLPVLIVQHMPPLFTQRLAESLNDRSALQVVEAQNGQRPLVGSVYIAPGGQQMKLQKGINLSTTSIVITDDPPERHCKPSVNYLFRSAAQIYQGAVLAVILTGMGDDGSIGLRLLGRHGAQIIAQDEASCTVFGMPKEAIKTGTVDKILPLDKIADELTRIAKAAQ